MKGTPKFWRKPEKRWKSSEKKEKQASRQEKKDWGWGLFKVGSTPFELGEGTINEGERGTRPRTRQRTPLGPVPRQKKRTAPREAQTNRRQK